MKVEKHRLVLARKAVLFALPNGGSRGTATAVPPCLIHIITDVRTEGVGARSDMSVPAVVSLLLPSSERCHRRLFRSFYCFRRPACAAHGRPLHAPDDLVDIFDMIPFHVSADAV